MNDAPMMSTDDEPDARARTAQAWQAHRQVVQGWLRRRLADPMLVEDLTQESFLRLHRAQPQLQEPGRLRAWLLRTAHNLLIDQMRAQAPEMPLDELLVQPLRPDPPFWRSFEPCIAPLAQRLPEDYRAVLLWDLDGVPQQEIAQRQGIGLSGAKSRVQRARGLLGQEFMRCCGRPDAGDAPADCAAADAHPICP